MISVVCPPEGAPEGSIGGEIMASRGSVFTTKCCEGYPMEGEGG